MKKKQKDPNALRFKDYFGTTTMSVTDCMASGFMTSLFMMYLTDYAGIGKWGAILGSALLMFARLFDAVNDPLEGYIMDKAKVGKHGKYRPFILISILFTAVGVSGLFFLPEAISNSPVLICAWVIGFYLLFDIGASFYAPNLVYRTMTLDPNERGKLMIGPRMAGMLVGMLGTSLLTIINTINASINNMHTSFGLAISGFMLVGCIVSVIGLALVKERHHAPQKDNEEKVKLTDIFLLLKENKALRYKFLDQLCSGFIWTFLFATMSYYIKWGFCTDLSTGEVDTASMGLYVMLGAMLMFVPLILGTFIATPIMKKIGSPIKFHRILILLQAISCLLLFVLEILGILRGSPALFFGLMAIVTVAIGCDYIPGEILNIEVMDYEIYLHGKDRSALCNAFNRFLVKGQSAVSSGLIGVILVAIGYEVDSVTDAFIGELSAIPTMLTWFIVVMGLVPGILGVISFLFLRKYPINNEIRAEMNEKLRK